MMTGIYPIDDLIKIAKSPTADIEMLMCDCYQRGFINGKQFAKKKAIEAIEQEK